MEIIVDTREPKWIAERIKAVLPAATVRRDYLESGDILLPGKVLIERKAISDLAQSLTSKRLHQQMNVMQAWCMAENLVGIVGIHDGIETLEYTGVGLNELLGAMASIVVRYGFQVFWIEDKVSWSYAMAKILEKFHQGKRGIPWNVSWKGIDKRVLVVSQLLGVAPSIARAVLRHFGTVEALLQADEGRLQQVPGIGPKKAQRIWKVLHEKLRA